MKLKSTIICILFMVCFSNAVLAQNVEINLSVGMHFSSINFHHTSDVNSNDDTRFTSNGNSDFNLGITAPIGKKLYFRTELGFLKTNSFFIARYKYDEGFGEQSVSKITHLTNQKMYLGILPEYKTNFDSLTLKLSGGLLISSDISNTFATSNTDLLPKSTPLGIKIGGGIQYMWNKIGFEFRVSYAKFGQSELQNIWHPKVSYDLVLLNWGVVYAL